MHLRSVRPRVVLFEPAAKGWEGRGTGLTVDDPTVIGQEESGDPLHTEPLRRGRELVEIHLDELDVRPANSRASDSSAWAHHAARSAPGSRGRPTPATTLPRPQTDRWSHRRSRSTEVATGNGHNGRSPSRPPALGSSSRTLHTTRPCGPQASRLPPSTLPFDKRLSDAVVLSISSGGATPRLMATIRPRRRDRPPCVRRLPWHRPSPSPG